MVEPLLSDLGFLGDSSSCNSILKGTYTSPDSLDDYSKAFLCKLAKPTNIINPPKAFISIESFRSG